MKLLGRLFCIDFTRAVFSVRFLVTVLCMVIVEMISSLPFLKGSDIIDVIYNIFGGTGSAMILLCILPLLPFSLSYAKDMEDNALGYTLVRSNTGLFMLNRFFVACLSAFLCVIVSFLVLGFVLHIMGYPFFEWYERSGDAGYIQLLNNGNPFAYLFFYLTHRGFSAMTMAACAVCISTIFPNTFFAFTAPVCIYILALRVVYFPMELQLEHPYLQVANWIEGIYASPAGDLATFLCKFGVTVMVCVIYGVVTVLRAVRRWHYA